MKADNEFLDFKYNNIEPIQGTSLVSMPLLSDSYFARSVVYVTENNEKGSFGFILNKPSKHKLHELMSGFGSSDFPIFNGGPVGTDTIHFIHTLGNTIPDTIHVAGNIYWGGNFDAIKQMVNSKEISNNEIRFFLGYSGWSPNQLNEELQSNTWLVENLDESLIFDCTNNKIWEKALDALGGKYKMWVNFPANPILN